MAFLSREMLEYTDHGRLAEVETVYLCSYQRVVTHAGVKLSGGLAALGLHVVLQVAPPPCFVNKPKSPLFSQVGL